jgi:hypothetical protein
MDDVIFKNQKIKFTFVFISNYKYTIKYIQSFFHFTFMELQWNPNISLNQ